MTLTGKVALVAGAKGGLGTQVTRAFLDAGARVAGVSRSIAASDFPSGEFAPIPADLTRSAEARRVVEECIEKFGRIDALVHVMGGFAGGSRVDETDDATVDQMLDLNYRAAFFMTRAVLPHMRKQGSGRILVVASRQGVEPGAMVAAYSASKAAAVALVHCIALENKDAGITANSVLPGTMETPGNRGANLVQPSQVAALLVHLASDVASQITGAAIPVYGSQL